MAGVKRGRGRRGISADESVWGARLPLPFRTPATQARLDPAFIAYFCLLDRGGEKEVVPETRQTFEVAAALHFLLPYKILIILKQNDG